MPNGSRRAITKAFFGFTEINVLKMRAVGPGMLHLARGGAHFEHVDFGKSFSTIQSPCQGSCCATIKAMFGFTEINVLKMRAVGPGCWALPGVARILSVLISGRVSLPFNHLARGAVVPQ